MGGASYPKGTLLINGNPKLECAPSGWPEKDMGGNTIRQAPCGGYGNCSASDPFLGLTNVHGGFYCAQSEAAFVKLAKCRSINYWCLWGCSNCTQTQMDSVQLVTIRGKDPQYGYSLYIENADAITSLAGLSGLSGAPQGA